MPGAENKSCDPVLIWTMSRISKSLAGLKEIHTVSSGPACLLPGKDKQENPLSKKCFDVEFALFHYTNKSSIHFFAENKFLQS
jgi:hypothetical protein